MDEGLKTLLDIFNYSPRGRKTVSEESIALAQKEGYLFDYPEYESHAETIKRLFYVLNEIDPVDIANAFLFSLSTRRLEYRSALGSYYYAKAVPAHELMKSRNEILAASARHCYLCGWTAWEKEPDRIDLKYGLNFYNWQRYKYGGSAVGILHINYALFDLERFIKLPKVTPSDEDIRILKGILACVGSLEETDKAGKLREAILKAKLFRSNKDEAAVLLGELGICGILAGNDSPSYDVFFADEYQRDPVEYKNDFAYPVNRWHARDGINTERVKEVFGDVL